MNTLDLKGTLRTETGKTQIKTVRSKGMVPCVLHAANGAVHFSAALADVSPIIYTPQTFIVNLEVDGKKYKSVISETQFHPVHEKLLHADFTEVRDDKPIVVNIPVILFGNSPGVLAGGKLVQKVRKMRIKGSYTKLPTDIKIDISALKLSQSLKVRDLKFDDFTIVMAPDVPVATVEIPRALRQDQGPTKGPAAPAAAAAAAAPAAAAKAAAPAAAKPAAKPAGKK